MTTLDLPRARLRLEAYLRSPLSGFTAWRTPDGRCPQGEFVMAAADHRFRVARWANRTGKSEVGVVDMLLAALGWHPTFPMDPPLTMWSSALDWPTGHGQILWPKFKDWLPMDEVAPNGISYLRKSPEIPLAIRFRNGTTIDFKSADSGRRKYQGAKIDYIWLDEEHPPDIFEECEARLLDSGGHLTVTATPIMRARWLQDLERRDGVFVNRANMLEMAETGIINKAAVLAFADSLPERQRRVRIFGEIVAREGAVYQNFAPATHVAVPRDGSLWIGDKRVCEWPLPSSWPRHAAWDFGFHVPTAVLRAAHDATAGRLIVDRCWYASNIRTSRWADMLKDDLSHLASAIVCDRSADGRAEIEARGMATQGRSGWSNPNPGLELVERLLQPKADGIPALIFVKDPSLRHPELGRCDTFQLVRELEHYHYPEDKEGRPTRADLPVKENDHGCDGLRYLCVALVTACRRPVSQAAGLRHILGLRF